MHHLGPYYLICKQKKEITLLVEIALPQNTSRCIYVLSIIFETGILGIIEVEIEIANSRI